MFKRSKRNQSTLNIGLIIVVVLALFSSLTACDTLITPPPIADVPPVATLEAPTEIIPTLELPTQAIPPDTAPSGDLSSWLKIYFTNPNPPDQVGAGIDQYVVAEVNNAQNTIDVTSFDLNLPSFVDALVAATQRGVQVRVVYDGKEGNQVLAADRSPTGADFNVVSVMQDAGIQLVDDGRSTGLMHDKIIVIDSHILFMGSWNMSYNDTYRNNNNLLEITDPTLIANYQAKFDELFIDRQFGTHATVGALVPELTIGTTPVLNYFSPVDDVMNKLVDLVNGAETSIRFIAFTYTHTDLANAMIGRFQAGVDVAGIIENRGASQGAMVPLACAKVPVKVDGNKYTMHHKVIVIDESIVITGSFNFTKSADTQNDDNVLVIYDRSVARQYLDEFDRLNAMAKDPDPAKITCP